MIRRLGVFWSVGALLATTFVALTTVGMSAAHAASFEDWATVSAGSGHTCGVRTNGKLYCWGSDDTGQVGDGNGNSTPVATPRRIGSFVDWANVSAGNEHTCGVRTNGKLYCWGLDSTGQVGDGGVNSDAITEPKRIGTFEDWTNASAGGLHSCGIRHGGRLYCWGGDDFGQVGDGSTNPPAITEPKRIGTFEDWATVSAGSGHTCGIRTNGKLYCWGFDSYGQIGDGESPDSASSPRRIGTFEDWANVSAGDSHTCGVRTNGKLYCWGNDGYGQVGDGAGDSTPVITPRRIGAFEDWANSSAVGHSCGVRRNGKLYCWGYNGNGEVGDGGTETSIDAPKRIGTFEDWGYGASGGYHTCGIRHGGKLYCWGADSNGQVGDGAGNSSPVTSPRRI